MVGVSLWVVLSGIAIFLLGLFAILIVWSQIAKVVRNSSFVTVGILISIILLLLILSELVPILKGLL